MTKDDAEALLTFMSELELLLAVIRPRPMFGFVAAMMMQRGAIDRMPPTSIETCRDALLVQVVPALSMPDSPPLQ